MSTKRLNEQKLFGEYCVVNDMVLSDNLIRIKLIILSYWTFRPNFDYFFITFSILPNIEPKTLFKIHF